MGYNILKSEHPSKIRRMRELNRQYSALYREINADGQKSYMRAYYKEKLNKDPSFRLAHYARTTLNQIKYKIAEGAKIGYQKRCQWQIPLAQHIVAVCESYKTTPEHMVEDGYTFDHVVPANLMGEVLYANGIRKQSEADKIINDIANVDIISKEENMAKHDKLREVAMPVAELLEKKYPELKGLRKELVRSLA